MTIRVDQERLWRRLMTLAEHGATPAGGVNRQAFSAEDASARQLIVGWAKDLGFDVSTDPIGNLFVRRPGTDPAAAPVISGSHLDSQPTGGKFDGAYGVMAAFEAIEAIGDANVETRRSIEAVAWVNEEGSRFQPGMMGSQFFCGHHTLEEVRPLRDAHGVELGGEIERLVGATPQVAMRETGFDVAAYVEAHIEQGPRLEAADTTIGVVDSVQGLRWFAIEVLGEAAHAGTTPRAAKRDAFVVARRIIAEAEAVATDDADTIRFTVGRFEVQPGTPNTVPSRVFFTIDLRHPEQETLDRVTATIEAACANAAPCVASVERTEDVAPTIFDPSVVDEVERSARSSGHSWMRMVSGAGHDAMALSLRCPSGMIFVPCERGISHNELEAARPSDVAAGAQVLADTLVALANR